MIPARRCVIDLNSPRTAWRVTPDAVRAFRDALGAGWAVVEVDAPAASDGDGGSGSAASVTAARGAEIYLGYGVSPSVVAAGRGSLRWAHSGTAGVAGSLAALRGTGIVLTNSAGIHAAPIADWAIAAVAYFARGLDRMLAYQRAAHWAKAEFTDLRESVRELQGLRVGIVGLGGIGRAVAARALGLGMEVAGVRRQPARGAPTGVQWVGGTDDLPRLADRSDALVIAAPHTRLTGALVGRGVLDRLPQGAIVVNVSRGELLDEIALLALLDAGRIRGVALDVFAVEPLPPNHAFWNHPRVLISPHAAGVTSRFWERETGLIVENIRRYLEGAPLLNVVDLEAGY